MSGPTGEAKERAPGCHDHLAECEAVADKIEGVLLEVVAKPSDESKAAEPCGMFERLSRLRYRLGDILDHVTAVRDTLGTNL